MSEVLHPDGLRPALLSLSLYVLVYEMLRENAVEHLRILHSRGFSEKGWIIDNDGYTQDVLARHKDQLRASLMWFVQYGAIEQSELERLDELRELRNRAVHDLLKLVQSQDLYLLGPAYSDLARIFRKLEVWWVRNMEIDGDEDSSHEALTDEDITPGPMLILQMITDVAMGDAEQSLKWHRAFVDAEAELDARSTPGSV